MPDDDIIAAQKAIDEAVKNVDPALSPTAIPPEPEPVPEKQPDLMPPSPLPATPINETGEKLVSELLEEPAPIPTVTPPHVQSQHPLPPSGGMKKKSGKGAILAIIATLLLTLPIAVYFLSQQNQQIAELRSRATGNTYQYECNINDPNACNGNPSACHCQGGDACTGTICEPNIETSCRNQGRSWCDNMYGQGKTCCVAGYVCNPNGDGCVPGGGNPTATPRPGDDDDDNDDDNTNPTATPTTGTAPVCQNIKIYKGGVQVTPSTLRAGDDVVLAVKGNLAPTKAHFRVNGGAWTQTTTKNAANEFTLSYTIPAGVIDFVIEGEVFTNGAWR